MQYTVTRQLQWPDGKKIVEVSIGSLDYCNPDALSPKFDGEFRTFDNPIEAIETAIEVCRQWRKAGSKDAKVGIGNTMGFTLPFDPSTFKELRTIGKELFKQDQAKKEKELQDLELEELENSEIE